MIERHLETIISNFRLTVYDVLGQKIGTIADKVFQKGEHQLEWQPAQLSPGVYYLQAESKFGDQKIEKLIISAN